MLSHSCDAKHALSFSTGLRDIFELIPFSCVYFSSRIGRGYRDGPSLTVYQFLF